MQYDVKEWSRGCLHVYTGDGKGKTTAALGLTLRAAGRGLSCFVGQFMKNYPYGELRGVAALEKRITIEQFGSPECISYRENPDKEDIERAANGLDRCSQILEEGHHAVVVLDEILVAVHFHLMDESALFELLDKRPSKIEVICTGRFASKKLIDKADLVTEMRSVKHYYDSMKLEARDGIER